MAFLALLILTGVLAYKQLKKKERDWRKILGLIVLFCFAALFGTMDTLERYYSPKADKKEIIDTTINSARATRDSINAAIDSTRKAILDSIRKANNELKSQGDANTKAIIDSKPKVELNPHLNICNQVYGRNNPFLLSTVKDTLKYVVSICNDGNAIATNIIDKFLIINYITDTPTFEISNLSLSNRSLEIAPNQPGAVFPLWILLPATPDINTASFVYFRISYTKENDKKVKYLRKIFGIYPNKTLRDISGFQYDEISKALMKNRLW